MQKKYRVVYLSLCPEHNRITMVLLSAEKQLDPNKHIIEKPQPRQTTGGMLILSYPPQMQHLHRDTVIFDLSPQEYEELGSPAVNEIMKIGINKVE